MKEYKFPEIVDIESQYGQTIRNYNDVELTRIKAYKKENQRLLAE
jgi:hypothetical protein